MKAKQMAALLRLFDETHALSRRLRSGPGAALGDDLLSAGRRTVLESLDSLGPQTVPQLARARAVSRQHMQLLVNGLLADNLVATAQNPAHKTSPLIALTAKGRHRFRAGQARRKKILTHLHLGLPAKEIDTATAALHAISRAMKSGSGD